jgi:integrase
MSMGVTTTGNHYVQYRVPGLKSPRKEYFGKGESGQDKAEIRQEEIKAGELVTMESLAGRQIYLDELAQLYINYVKIFKGKKHWVKGLVGLTNNHYLPCLCHVPIDELAFSDFLNLAMRFSEKSACTQNRYMEHLHIMLRFGAAQGLIQKDPMQGWKKHRETKRDVKLTLEDLQKIYAHAVPHLQWLLEVQWELGTRPGPSELFAIRWSDVDFDHSLIRVRGTKTKTSDRLIPISDEFKERLLAKQAEASSTYLIEYKGKPITTCKTTFKKACKAAKIEYPVRLYDIRHLFASTMLANGGDLKAVSKLLGHSTTVMTADVYYHELKGEKERALAVKPRLLGTMPG